MAAYVRVSTDHEEQLTSYEAQVDYYTGYIKSREDWEFVHVYTDEGISATGIAKREGFRKMVEDALAGSIDLIVTKSILVNEKYKGDALLQKSYTVDFLTKKTKINEGEVPQYYVENSHEAIISPAVFDEVQHQMAVQHPGKNCLSCTGAFSSRIKCGDCGDWYSLVEYATVYSREDIRFTFKNGMEIKP